MVSLESKLNRLYPYQIEDVRELEARPRIILGSVMRAGKMIEILELVRRLDLWQVLVVCPKPLVAEWEYKIETWLGSEWKARFDVYNYEKLRRPDLVRLMCEVGYELIVMDECHKVKNRSAKQTKGAIELARSTQRLILASGTPMENHPGELWTLLHMIDPATFRAYWPFVERYCIVTQLPKPPFPKVVVGARSSTKQELRELLSHYMLRREKYELLDHEGRPIVGDRAPVRTIPVQLTDEQLAAYITMEDQMFALIASGEKITSPNVLSQRLRLRQICLEPTLLSPTHKTSSPSAKTEVVLELADDLTKPFVVVTCFEQYARILTKELTKNGYKAVEFSGAPDISPYRHQLVQDFQSGKYDVMVGTITSMGLGLTLTAAHQIVITDQHYNPQVMDQAVSRLEGTGQKYPVEAIDLWAKNTVEDHLHKVLERKSRMFKDIIVTEQEVWEETVREMMKRRAYEGK
ncbi:MAG: DEAD/DEAH box helicase [Nitrososphaerales archaeon]